MSVTQIVLPSLRFSTCFVVNTDHIFRDFISQDAASQPFYQMAASLRVLGINGPTSPSGLAKFRVAGNGNVEILYQDRLAHNTSAPGAGPAAPSVGPRLSVTMQVRVLSRHACKCDGWRVVAGLVCTWDARVHPRRWVVFGHPDRMILFRAGLPAFDTWLAAVHWCKVAGARMSSQIPCGVICHLRGCRRNTKGKHCTTAICSERHFEHYLLLSSHDRELLSAIFDARSANLKNLQKPAHSETSFVLSVQVLAD